MSNITRNIEGFEVYQRVSDGFINATQICKVNQELRGQRKDPSEWFSNKSSKSMIEKLSVITGIPVIKLVEQKTGKYGGTWIHPRLAVRFAMWVNDDFSLQVEDWVQEWMATKQNPIHTSTSSTEPTIEEIERVFAPLYKLGIKEGLIESAKLTSIAASIPRLEPSVENAKQLISASLPTEEIPVSPTQLGIIFGDLNNLDKPPSGQKVNQALLNTGFQFKNDNKDWQLTEAGEKYGQQQFETVRKKNKTIVVIRWFPSVLERISKYL
ncbi:MAG: KilA-N domain-containing protein [Prochloraceae cyanobacterium]